MNYNRRLKLLWWATAGCGSRSNNGVFTNLGDETMWYNSVDNVFHNIRLERISHTHTQGIPPGCEDYKIICLIRNPYTRSVSHYIDLVHQDSNLKFEDFITKGRTGFDRYWDQWKAIGRDPDYIIRLENPIEDWKKVSEASQIIGKNEFDALLERVFEVNHYAHSKPLDKYDSNGHQIVNRFFTQEFADILYKEEKFIFDLGGYKKDSWK